MIKDKPINELTKEETLVVDKLIEAWNVFAELPIAHDDDITEFRRGIHQCQNIILSRPTSRVLNSKIKDYNNANSS